MTEQTPVQALRRMRCWWRGHDAHPQDPSPPEAMHCMHCNELMSYDDFVGDSRQYLFRCWVRYWFFRRWFPEKCRFCGYRRGHSDGCDDIPF